MDERSDDQAVLDTLLSVERSTRWRFDGGVTLGFDVGHPQGMVLVGGAWCITTLDRATGRGWILTAGRDGALRTRTPCGDEARFHPGGTDLAHDGSLWLAMAEYRPASTTDVFRIDAGGGVEHRFRHQDHLGALALATDGTLVSWTWGSRRLLRLDVDGTVLAERTNPSHFVDHQDLHLLATGHAVCTGVGRALVKGGRKLGGIGVLRLDDLTWVTELPFFGYSPTTDQVATYNPMHLEVADGRLHLHLLPDEGEEASILTWSIAMA